jgi:6-phosphogluconolactonase
VVEPAVKSARVAVVPDAEALVRLAAGEVARRAGEAVRARGRFAVALAGGSTPQALHRLLADPAAPYRQRVDWRRTHVFFGDERCVPPDHPDSNFGAARAALLAHVPVPAGQVHRLRGEDPAPARAAADYERELRALGAAPGQVPRLDLVVLGLGEDGHTASLFPGTAALLERERLVLANHVPQLGAWRLTVTLPLLAAARAALFLVSGARKAGAVAAVLADAGRELPAGRVRLDDGDLGWLLDGAAAARLPAAARGDAVDAGDAP